MYRLTLYSPDRSPCVEYRPAALPSKSRTGCLQQLEIVFAVSGLTRDGVPRVDAFNWKPRQRKCSFSQLEGTLCLIIGGANVMEWVAKLAQAPTYIHGFSGVFD